MPPEFTPSWDSLSEEGTENDALARGMQNRGMTDEQVKAWMLGKGVAQETIDHVFSEIGRSHGGGKAKDPGTPIRENYKDINVQVDDEKGRGDYTHYKVKKGAAGPMPMFRGDRAGG